MSVVLFTSGKQTFKDLGETGEEQHCVWCSEPVFYHLILVRTWLTYWFVPFLPYRRQYRIECPACAAGVWLRGEEVEAAKRGELKLCTREAATEDEQP